MNGEHWYLRGQMVVPDKAMKLRSGKLLWTHPCPYCHMEGNKNVCRCYGHSNLQCEADHEGFIAWGHNVYACQDGEYLRFLCFAHIHRGWSF